MAITKLMKIGECRKGSNPHAHLKNSIFYICQEKKTEGGLYVCSNAGSTAQAVYQSMVLNKEYWKKTGERQGYHYILSFSPSEQITPALCSQIAGEFAEKLLGENYLYVTAAHTDKGHLHAHIVFDSVSCTDGLKFHSPTGDWERTIQPITDELCRKYQLETLQYEKNGDRNGKPYAEWRHEKKNGYPQQDYNQKQEKQIQTNGELYSPYDIIRDDIDEAIQRSEDYKDFLEKLKEMKYQINRNQKILSVKPHWRNHAVRTGRLGKGYSKEEICQRLSDKKYMPAVTAHAVHYGNMREINQVLFVKVRQNRSFRMSSFQRQYYRRLYRIYHIRKPVFRDVSWKYKEDILQVKRISKCCMTLLSHDIRTMEELQNRIRETQEKSDAANRAVNALKTKLHRSELFRHLSRYEAAQKQFLAEPSAENMQTIQELQTKIEKICPVAEAKEKRERIKEEIYRYNLARKDIRKELYALKDAENLQGKQENAERKYEKDMTHKKGTAEWEIRI